MQLGSPKGLVAPHGQEGRPAVMVAWAPTTQLGAAGPHPALMVLAARTGGPTVLTESQAQRLSRALGRPTSDL